MRVGLERAGTSRGRPTPWRIRLPRGCALPGKRERSTRCSRSRRSFRAGWPAIRCFGWRLPSSSRAHRGGWRVRRGSAPRSPKRSDKGGAWPGWRPPPRSALPGRPGPRPRIVFFRDSITARWIEQDPDFLPRLAWSSGYGRIPLDRPDAGVPECVSIVFTMTENGYIRSRNNMWQVCKYRERPKSPRPVKLDRGSGNHGQVIRAIAFFSSMAALR